MTLIECEFGQHGDAVLAIFNDAILNTTALYEYEPRTGIIPSSACVTTIAAA